MHIGLIVVQFPSYSETFFVNQVTGLCERGHHVTVFCERKHEDKVLEEAYELKKHKNLRVVTIGFDKKVLLKKVLTNPALSIKSLKASFSKTKTNFQKNLLLKHFSRHNCDIYHFGYSGLAISYLPLFKNLPGKTMVSCLGTAEKVKALADPYRRKMLRELFSAVDSIHSVSGDMARTIKKYGASEDKIYINRPAIDPNFFKRKTKYEDKKFVQILSIGRLVFQKGFLVGLLAIKDLKKNFPHFRWKIVGEGIDKEQMIFHIHTMGLEEHVQLVGKKKKGEVLELYEESDIFFLPSVYEGIANVSLESMSMEMPIVSSINGGMDEAITHDLDGLLSENYDHTSMTKQLYDLCTNYEKRKLLGENARRKVIEKFSVSRYIDVFEREYIRLIHRKLSDNSFSRTVTPHNERVNA